MSATRAPTIMDEIAIAAIAQTIRIARSLFARGDVSAIGLCTSRRATVSEKTGKPTKSVAAGSPSAAILCVNGYIDAPIATARPMDRRYPMKKTCQSCVDNTRKTLEIKITASVYRVQVSTKYPRHFRIRLHSEFYDVTFIAQV